MRPAALFSAVVLGLLAPHALAQQYELVDPATESRATAVVDAARLSLTDERGRTTIYARDRQYDAPAADYRGYVSLAVGRVIRFPVAEGAPLQIASLEAPELRFRVSRLEVWPVGAEVEEAGIAEVPAAEVVREPPEGAQTELGTLATRETAATERVLRARSNRSLVMGAATGRADQYWHLSPVGRGFYRLQRVEEGRLWSLSARGAAGPVVLEPSMREPRQLWRVTPAPFAADSLRIESVAYPERYLSGRADGVVGLERPSDVASQLWIFGEIAPPPSGMVLPTVHLIHRALEPGEPLEAARVRLENTHAQELWVVIQDLRPDGPRQRVRIPPGAATDVLLERDPGGRLVESYEIRSPLGEVVRETLTTALPPATLYDVSVYEMFLQSIAIDRTGKSPQMIEDENYRPRSVGIFAIPPGDRFAGGSLDVFAAAQEAGNPGGVRPIQLDRWQPEPPREDPLQRVLREATR